MSTAKKKKVATMENPYVRQHEIQGMIDHKRKKRLFRRLITFGTLVAVITFLLVSTLISQTSQLEAKQVEKAQLHTSLKDLKSKESSLKEEIVQLNDDDYIAKLARKDYFLSDKGEIIFNIPESKKKKTDEE
jgi:cell division protein DivIC